MTGSGWKDTEATSSEFLKQSLILNDCDEASTAWKLLKSISVMLTKLITQWLKSWQNLFLPYAKNKCTYQHVHLCNLISAFFVCCLDKINIYSYSILNFKTQTTFCSWAGWFDSHLVALPQKAGFFYDMSRCTTKPTKRSEPPRRLRSAWASAQSDQSLHCARSG